MSESIMYYLAYKYLSKELSDNLNRDLFNRFELSFKEAFSEENIETYGNTYKQKALNEYGYFIYPEYTYNNIIKTKKPEFREAFEKIEFKNKKYNEIFTNIEDIPEKILEDISKLNQNQTLEKFNNRLNRRYLRYNVNSSKILFKIMDTIKEENINTIYTPTIILNQEFYKKFKNKEIYTQSTNHEAINLLFLSLIMNNIKQDKIKLKEETWLNKLPLKNNADLILIDIIRSSFKDRKLILGSEIDFKTDERFQNFKNIKHLDTEAIIILNSLYYLKQDGLMITKTPPILTFSPRSQELNKHLIKNNLLDTIISTKSRDMNESYILIINKNKKTRDVLFINATEEYDEDKIIKTYQERLEYDNYSRLVSLDEIKENNYMLPVNRYIYEKDDVTPVKDFNKKINEINKKLIENSQRLNENIKKMEKVKN